MLQTCQTCLRPVALVSIIDLKSLVVASTLPETSAHSSALCVQFMAHSTGRLTIHPSWIDILKFHSCMHASFPVAAYSALTNAMPTRCGTSLSAPERQNAKGMICNFTTVHTTMPLYHKLSSMRSRLLTHSFTHSLISSQKAFKFQYSCTVLS